MTTGNNAVTKPAAGAAKARIPTAKELEARVKAQQAEIESLRARVEALDAGFQFLRTLHRSESSTTGQTDTGATVDVPSNGNGASRSTDPLPSAARVMGSGTGTLASMAASEIARSALVKGFTTPMDVVYVEKLCTIINPHAHLAILRAFYTNVVHSSDTRPIHLKRLDKILPKSWYEEPWYNLYVQYTGTKCASLKSDFDGLIAMIPYIRKLGFSNVLLLPHFESCMADGGYDVTSYLPRRSLGGLRGFQKFMIAAFNAGIRVGTDAIFNHTSTEHTWFKKAVDGDARYIAYYLQRNGREKIAEFDRNGDIVCQYRDPDGVITERPCVFPEVDRTHGLWTEINAHTYQFYREFNPFQVDLNLQNPDVLNEVFEILGRELNDAVLAKRLDAIAHWIKKPGDSSDSHPESHAIQALLKAFIKHVSPRAVVLPEVVKSMEVVASYAGVPAVVNRIPCPSGGDALFSFEMQAALREMIFFESIAPFWKAKFRTPRLPDGAVWANLLEHHDEIFLGFFPPETRRHMREYIVRRGGIVFKNGLSAGARYAECLDRDPNRIAVAIFLLYMCPGVPFVYTGVEIGWTHSHAFMKKTMADNYVRCKRLGMKISKKGCLDPRELHRGPIPKGAFDTAVATGYPPYRMLSRLNHLRQQRASLRTTVVHTVESGKDAGIFAAIRDGNPDDCPLLCLANLTAAEKRVQISLKQTCLRLGLPWLDCGNLTKLHVTDIVSSTPHHFERDGDCWTFTMGPRSCYIFEFAALGSTL